MNTNRGYAYAPVYGSQKTSPLLQKADYRMNSNEPDFSELNAAAAATEGIPSAQPVSFQAPAASYFPYYGTVNPAMQAMPDPNSPSYPQQPVLYFQQPVYDYNGTMSQQAPAFSQGNAVSGQNAMPIYPPAQMYQPAEKLSQSKGYPNHGTIPAFAAADRMNSDEPGTMQTPYNSYAFQNRTPTQPVPPADPKPPKNKPDLGSDPQKVWAIYFFVFLPLLFVPCLFVTGSLTMLRYVFIALCMMGLAVVWIKKLFTGSIRLILSMVYLGMAVLLILMFFPITTASQNRPTEENSYTQSPITIGGVETALPSSYSAIDFLSTEEPVETPIPTPESVSEAENRLVGFMNYWTERNTQEMVNYVQPSWRNAQADPATSLFTLLANRTPEGYTIEEVSGGETDTSRTITMSASINKNNGKPNVTYRFTIMMVKEGDNWYVNPNSLASNDSIDTAESIVVNDSNSKTQVTPAPRTTVTPEPPASTTLYYNENGGSFYHVDQFCPSVKDEYLPLTGTFSYRELTDYVKALSLQPCLKCGAPINPPSGGNEQ